MATLTKGKTFTSNEVVTPTKLNDLVDQATISNIVAAEIANGAIITDKILDLNVTTAKLADDSVTADKLADSATTDSARAVTTNHIRDLSITNAKIRSSTACSVIGRSANTGGAPADIAAATDGHVLRRSSGVLSFGQIASANLAADVIITDKILNLNVTTAKLADNAVTADKLADSATTDSARAVTTNHIRDLAVTTAKLADNAITADKLADHASTDASRAVTTNHIRDLAITTAKLANDAVTADKLATNAIQAIVPAGAVMPFAMNSAPSGWLAANGSNVSRSSYAALFSAIGTTYGTGNGSTTFTLPDLRGYFVRGHGTNSDGTASGSFGVKQLDDFKSHTHSYTAPNTPGYYYDDNNDVQAVSALTANTATSATGGTETRPKNIAMLYCIKF